MLGKLLNGIRIGVLTAHAHITRRKYSTYVYQTPWLQAKYAVHTKRTTADVMTLITDQIIENLPFEPTMKQIAQIRSNPQITILEAY